MHSLRVIAGNGVSFMYPGQEPIIKQLTFALASGDRIGLVGANGMGKSTLLRLLVGELRPTSGSLVVPQRIAYLPQASEADPECGGTIDEALGIAEKRAALRRVQEGSVDPKDFDLIGEDWDVEERGAALLASLGLEQIVRDPGFLDRRLAQVSGGELTRIRLAGLLLARPEALMLDEPTNHLDEEARSALRQTLASYGGALLVASHDRELLGMVTAIWELGPRGLAVYGGNYDHYVEQKQVEDAARRAAVDSAKQALATAKDAGNEARERQQHRMATARRNAPKMGLPKIIIGGLKRQAQASLAKLEDTHQQRVADAEARLAEAKEALVETQTIRIDLTATAIPRTKMVLELDGLQDPLWRNPISTRVTGPQRIALVGSNGVGKTTLLTKILAGVPGVRWGVTRVAYLDQRVSVLRGDLTVLENLRHATPRTPETERRIKLGRFLFGGDAAFKLAGELSGGERMRAGLACVLLTDDPPELLLLDEPGNHLDRESLAMLEDALRSFQGAFVLVSHDRIFREAVGCDTEWRLTPDGLTPKEG